MDDSYIETTPAYVGRALKLVVLLLLLKVQNAPLWAAFVSLNPGIKDWLWRAYQTRYKDPETVDRRIRKVANLVSVVFLYSATSSNDRIPKDYILLYLAEAYYGKLVPPSSGIVLSPSVPKYLRWDTYTTNRCVKTLYAKKHFVVFPLLCGQLLSNYLTPTRFRLNQRYFSLFIKLRFLDPIWTNFRLGVKLHSVNWRGLFYSYAKHNVLLFVYFALMNVTSQLVAKSYQISVGAEGNMKRVWKNFLGYCARRANAVANFVYLPNLVSMLLLSLTAPQLTRFSPLKRLYMANQKQTIKWYMRVVGFVAGLLAMLIQTIDLVPAFGFKRISPATDKMAVHHLGAHFYNAINLYLAHVIVLLKWRILKENHPWFTLLKIGTWRRMETGVMCYLVWQLMNLNDYLSKNVALSDSSGLKRLRANPWVRAIDRIMK